MSKEERRVHTVLVYDTSDPRYDCVCEGATGVCYTGRKRTFTFSLSANRSWREWFSRFYSKDPLGHLDGMKDTRDREVVHRFLFKIYQCIKSPTESNIEEVLEVGGVHALDARELIALPHIIERASNIVVVREKVIDEIETCI